MNDSQDDLVKNKDKLNKIFRIMGLFFLILGALMMFSYNQQIFGSILIIQGFIVIVLTPRAIDWAIDLRQRTFEQNKKRRNDE